MGLRLSDIARTSQAMAPDPEGDGAFHTGPLRVRCLKLRGGLAHSRRLQGRMLFLGAQRDGPPLGGRTLRPVGTRLAVPRRELDLDHRVRALINRGRPAETLPTTRTGGLLRLPVDVEVVCGKALPLAGLPVIVPAHGTEQVDGILSVTFD